MQSPDSDIPPPDSAVAPTSDFRGRWWIRIALFVLHIVIVVAAMSLTPPGYFVQLGADTGLILIFSGIALWVLLFSAKTRRGILIFGILALGQAGFMALVGLHFQAEDRLLRRIVEEFETKKYEWASQIEQFRMDPLLEMTSGKRQLSVAELRELQKRARAGEAKLDELESNLMRSVAEAERRIAAVSLRESRNFRRGFESTRPAWDEEKKLMQDYLRKIELLTAFLIDRQGQYSQTSDGLVFQKIEYDQAFKKQLDAIAHSAEQLNSVGHRLKPD